VSDDPELGASRLCSAAPDAPLLVGRPLGLLEAAPFV
jgi:hypothetical protein